jgi:hypothetical protein
MPRFKEILLYKEFLGRQTHVRKDRCAKNHVHTHRHDCIIWLSINVRKERRFYI